MTRQTCFTCCILSCCGHQQTMELLLTLTTAAALAHLKDAPHPGDEAVTAHRGRDLEQAYEEDLDLEDSLAI